MNALIQECWRVRRKERPNFDQIVARLQGDIGDEIKRKEEPKIVLYSKEDDVIYRNRIGKEDELEDSDGDEEGTKRGGGTRKAHPEALQSKDRMLEELRRKIESRDAEHGEVVAAKNKEMEELRKKVSGVMSEVERSMREKAGEHERVRKELQELAETHKRVMEELEERRGGGEGGV
ncbi:hypothetical protein TeGR_g9473 [Tetraparma gracilis]|uniref:Serine-threonine/tyrosine-protein kinase catalytic domain-containing protein n=1 Tax=Tetraparma gracilis TaxID=2962635 RepID=A0ABQ6N4U7_9STRA|nr:hypothetical protein TeGR_g9473 [Tetraparma gracilis]